MESREKGKPEKGNSSGEKRRGTGRGWNMILLLAIVLSPLLMGFAVMTTVKGQIVTMPGFNITVIDRFQEKPIAMYEVVSESMREVTAYNVGVRAQTDDKPCIGARGDDLCERIKQGEKICALNGVPFGTKLLIQHYGECVVLDRMNRRYKNRVDIAMNTDELVRARKFGLQTLNVAIIKEVKQQEGE